MGTQAAEVKSKDIAWPAVAIVSRSVRLGSLKGTPYEPVFFSTGGLRLKMQCKKHNCIQIFYRKRKDQSYNLSNIIFLVL